jgi:hypothetical protein
MDQVATITTASPRHRQVENETMFYNNCSLFSTPAVDAAVEVELRIEFHLRNEDAICDLKRLWGESCPVTTTLGKDPSPLPVQSRLRSRTGRDPDDEDQNNDSENSTFQKSVKADATTNETPTKSRANLTDRFKLVTFDDKMRGLIRGATSAGLFTTFESANSGDDKLVWIIKEGILHLWKYSAIGVKPSPLIFPQKYVGPIALVSVPQGNTYFVDESVRCCIAIAAEKNVLLLGLVDRGALGLSFAKSRFVAIPTDFKISSIAGSSDGRIFLGGNDGSLYETHFTTVSSWKFQLKHRLVTFLRGLLGNLLEIMGRFVDLMKYYTRIRALQEEVCKLVTLRFRGLSGPRSNSIYLKARYLLSGIIGSVVYRHKRRDEIAIISFCVDETQSRLYTLSASGLVCLRSFSGARCVHRDMDLVFEYSAAIKSYLQLEEESVNKWIRGGRELSSIS